MEENEKLQAYLEGELSDSEVEAFEELIAKDAELEERVRLHRRLELAFEDPIEFALEEELKGIMEEGEKSADREETQIEEESHDIGDTGEGSFSEEPRSLGKSRRKYRTYLLVAAAIALLAVVGFFLTRSGPPIPSDELFAMHYSAYDASNERRSDDQIPKDLLDPAFDEYNAGNYQIALNTFSNILSKYPKHPRATFYLGMCQIETGAFAKARISFQTVIDHKQNLYMTQSAWYLGLICLNLGDNACVAQQLEPLSQNDNKYKEGAEEILEELNR